MLDAPQRYPRAGSQSYPTPAAGCQRRRLDDSVFQPDHARRRERWQLGSNRSKERLVHDPAPAVTYYCLSANMTLSACGLLSSRGSIASLVLRLARRLCLRLTHVVTSMTKARFPGGGELVPLSGAGISPAGSIRLVPTHRIGDAIHPGSDGTECAPRLGDTWAHDVERVLADIDADHGDRGGVSETWSSLAPLASFACRRGRSRPSH